MKFFTRKSWKGDSAGLVGLMGGKTKGRLGEDLPRWYAHFFIRREHWVWGYEEDWYDGPLPSFGLGPLFLVVWY